MTHILYFRGFIDIFFLQVKEEKIENEDEDEEKRLQIVEEDVKLEVKQEVNIKKENKEVHRLQMLFSRIQVKELDREKYDRWKGKNDISVF